MRWYLFFVLAIAVGFSGKSQQSVFETTFQPRTVTYNASPDPRECWEAVDEGVEITTNIGVGFFLIPSDQFYKLSEQLKDKTCTITVQYYNASEADYHATGEVVSIVCEGQTVYQRPY